MQVLFDEGALVRNGRVKLTSGVNELRIPPTVQMILASRIDRLPAEEKELLQTLAMIGKEFPLGIDQAGDREIRRRPGADAEQFATGGGLSTSSRHCPTSSIASSMR